MLSGVVVAWHYVDDIGIHSHWSDAWVDRGCSARVSLLFTNNFTKLRHLDLMSSWDMIVPPRYI